MSHYYLCSKSKTILKNPYFEYFIANYFPTLNKKDPVSIFSFHVCGRKPSYKVECFDVKYKVSTLQYTV